MTAILLNDLLRHLSSGQNAEEQSDVLRHAGKALLRAPDLVTDLIVELCQGPETEGNSEHKSMLLTAALDEGRMARENGQKQGTGFLERMTEVVEGAVAEQGTLASGAALAISGAWVRAGLAPPAVLGQAVIPVEASPIDGDEIPDIPDEMFADLFRSFEELGEQSVSALLAMFDEMLPTLPPEARFALVHKTAMQPDVIFGDAAAALLLNRDPMVASGAMAGLSSRLANGDVSRDLLNRLTILRSWVNDQDTLEGIDRLVRAAMKDGKLVMSTRTAPKTHQIVSSMIDGSGAQSLAMAVQTGSRRHVAVVLLKQGFGIKDAFAAPCSSASEQRQMIAGIAEQADGLGVTVEYAQWAIAMALGEGLAPAAGLVEVADVCGFDDLRPQVPEIKDLLRYADPAGHLDALSVQMRGRLINASENWPTTYPISESWFEDSDASTDAIESGTTEASLKRGLWKHLETRRGFWAMVFARNAALLRASDDPAALAFAAVAQALQDGRDLKKTPIIRFVHELSLEAWFAGLREGVLPDDDLRGPGLEVTQSVAPEGMRPAVTSFGKREREDLSRLLQPAMITLPWLEGFLSGLCTAPEFIPPSEWVSTVFNVVSEYIESDKDMQHLLDLVVAAYNHTQTALREGTAKSALCPIDPVLFAIWADGYLTAWEAHKPHWPKRALGKEGTKVRRLLEAAADHKVPSELIAIMPDWLLSRASLQK